VENNSINAQLGESSGVQSNSSAEKALSKVMPKVEAAIETEEKPKNKGGRPPKSHYEQPVNAILAGAAPAAALILKQHIDRTKGYKKLTYSLQRACEYVIDHAIGKARQKVEHSGGIMTYGELAKSADKLKDKPRKVLADALSVAQKYQDKTASDGGASTDGADTPPDG